MQKKILVILVVVLVLAAILGVVFYFIFWGGEKKGGSSMFQILDKAQTTGVPAFDANKLITNPMEEAPSANPLDKVANPFEDPYKNPFD